MTNREKYDQIFKDTFNLSDADLSELLEYQSVKEWDSVGHMSLVSALEEAFDIMLEMDDIVDFGTYHTGIATMRKYGVEI